MDPDRAHQLLARERERIEHAVASSREAEREAGTLQQEPGELGSEDLYETELEVGLAEDLAEQLAAVERAEARLAAGTYGLSVESGKPIPDDRLEAIPTVERTADEQRAFESGV
jgi:DnaK suppressor protein